MAAAAAPRAAVVGMGLAYGCAPENDRQERTAEQRGDGGVVVKIFDLRRKREAEVVQLRLSNREEGP
jgi:hypothetical protein